MTNRNISIFLYTVLNDRIFCIFTARSCSLALWRLYPGIYVEQKFKSLLLLINHSWCKTKYWQVTPTHTFYIFCYFAFDAKEWVGRPSFYRKRQKEDSWTGPFGLNAWNIFYLDLENKTPIEDLWLLIFNSDGIHLSLINQVSTQKPRWSFS